MTTASEPATPREPGPVPAEAGSCHWITVSGFAKTSTSDHLAHSLRNVTQNSRSAPVTLPRRPGWARTASCCQTARFSISRSAREWSAARRPKRSRTRPSMRPARITAIRETSTCLAQAGFGEPQPTAAALEALARPRDTFSHVSRGSRLRPCRAGWIFALR